MTFVERLPAKGSLRAGRYSAGAESERLPKTKPPVTHGPLLSGPFPPLLRVARKSITLALRVATCRLDDLRSICVALEASYPQKVCSQNNQPTGRPLDTNARGGGR